MYMSYDEVTVQRPIGAGSFSSPPSSLMTHNRNASIAAFSISKSVEPNEEEKVLISDSEQEITASTER